MGFIYWRTRENLRLFPAHLLKCHSASKRKTNHHGWAKGGKKWPRQSQLDPRWDVTVNETCNRTKGHLKGNYLVYSVQLSSSPPPFAIKSSATLHQPLERMITTLIYSISRICYDISTGIAYSSYCFTRWCIYMHIKHF